MNALYRYFGFDICMRFKRLDWGAQQASKLVDKLTERRP